MSPFISRLLIFGQAANAFVNYMCRHHSEIRNMQHAGQLILRAFAMAHHAISANITSQDSVGTTTLLAGILLPTISQRSKVESTVIFWW